MATLSNSTAEIGCAIFPAIDKIMYPRKNLVVIYFTHKDPVSISSEDAYSLYLFLITPTVVRFSDFARISKEELENTQPLAA